MKIKDVWTFRHIDKIWLENLIEEYELFQPRIILFYLFEGNCCWDCRVSFFKLPWYSFRGFMVNNLVFRWPKPLFFHEFWGAKMVATRILSTWSVNIPWFAQAATTSQYNSYKCCKHKLNPVSTNLFFAHKLALSFQTNKQTCLAILCDLFWDVKWHFQKLLTSYLSQKGNRPVPLVDSSVWATFNHLPWVSRTRPLTLRTFIAEVHGMGWRASKLRGEGHSLNV